MKKKQIALLLAILSVSCGLLNSNENLENIKSAEKKWAKINPADYTYTFSYSCFCPFIDEVKVVVEEYEVVAVLDIETGENYRVPYGDSTVTAFEQYPDLFHSVNDFFGKLKDAAKEADEMEVSFDDKTGMPVSVFIDRYKDAIDDEVSYTLSSLKID